MAQQKIDSLFDKEKIKSEIKEIKDYMDSQFKNASMGNFTSKGGGGGNTKEFDAMQKQFIELQKQNERLQIAANKLSETTRHNMAKEELERQKYADAKLKRENAEIQRENARINRKAQNAAKEIGYINNLEREVKELTLAVKQLESVETNEAKMMINTLKTKREELANFKAMYGDHTMRVGEYSRATNGLRLSMGMLAGELPNAAISARTFIMSISNNMQGLFQAIAGVRAENKKMAQDFKEGISNIKPQSLFKQLISSLFSVQTLLMVGVALFVAYGEEIWNLINPLTLAERATKAYVNAIKEGNSEFSTATKKFFELNAVMESTKKGFISKKDAVDEYNKAFGATNGHVKTFEEAQKRMEQQAPNYIRAMGMMAYANTFLAEAVKLYGEAEALRADKTVNAWQKVLAWFKRDYLGQSTSLEQAVLNKREAEAAAIDAQLENAIKGYNEAYSKFAKFAQESDIDIWGNEKNNKSGDTVQTQKNIFVKEEFWNKKRAEAEQSLIALKLSTAKQTTDGIIIEYEMRESAAMAFTTMQEELSKMELDDAIFTANQKAEIDKKRIDKEYERAQKLYNAGKISMSEMAKLANEYLEADETIKKNHLTDLAQAQHKHNLNLENIANEHIGIMRNINSDKYADEIYMLTVTEQEKQRILDLSFEREKARIQRGSLSDKILGGLGINTSNTVEGIKAGARNRDEKRSVSRERLTKEMNSPNATGEQKQAAERKLQELDLQAIADFEQEKFDIETAALQMKEDAKAEIIESSVETLKSLWDSYYEYLAEKIEKQQEIETKRNDERLAQFEDETKAGMHTAEELNDFKKRSADYQQSIDDEAARKKEELDKKKFLTEQAFASAQIWIQYAIATMKNNAQLGTALALPVNAFLLGSAIAQQVLVAAQTIPAFAEGGDMLHDGVALLGDGGKHELAFNKGTGEMFITKNVPTLYDLDGGTHIFPDATKVDLNSLLGMRVLSPNYNNTDPQMIGVLKSIDSRLKSQKAPQLHGISLMRQMQQSERFASRKKGLIN